MKRLLLLTSILAFGVLSAFSEDIHVFDAREPASQNDSPKQIRIPKNPWLRWLAENGFEPTEEATT